ncbi:GNAT family N-acetyltransferase [Microbulbifer sp. SA54]
METQRLTLAPCTEQHIAELMGWFLSATECRQWGGPPFRYPFDTRSFAEDSQWSNHPSFVLLDAGGAMQAFGQYYNRLDHCHLSRLVVAPSARRRGVGEQLIRNLVAHGCDALKVERISLFVLQSNPAARALYEKMGFRLADYPEPGDWLAGCDYLTVPARKILYGNRHPTRELER